MGLLEFNKLPINTLVGADWKTFKDITGGRDIGAAYKGKYLSLIHICVSFNRTVCFIKGNNLFLSSETKCSVPVSYTHLDVYKRQMVFHVDSFNDLSVLRATTARIFSNRIHEDLSLIHIFS